MDELLQLEPKFINKPTSYTYLRNWPFADATETGRRGDEEVAQPQLGFTQAFPGLQFPKNVAYELLVFSQAGMGPQVLPRIPRLPIARS